MIGITKRVFIDTEFTDFVNTDIISIGLVCEDGQSFYGENTQVMSELANPWVKKHILSLLDYTKYGYTKSQLSCKVYEWLENLNCNIIILYDYQTDVDLLKDLVDDHPMIIGFQNIFVNIISKCDNLCYNQSMIEKVKTDFFMKKLLYFEESKNPSHHALFDAHANKVAYLHIMDELK